MVAVKPFMGKAFSELAILSALLIAGFEGDKINILTIMNHNLEFNKLSNDSSNKVLRLIKTDFCDEWWRKSLIPEIVFDEAFRDDEDIDNNNHRTGKPLNDLATNRQRFMIDNHEAWFEELNRRREVANIAEAAKEAKRVSRELELAAKPAKFRNCDCTIDCQNLIDITTPKLKKDNEKLWKKCIGKKCNTWSCPDHIDMLNAHMLKCRKIDHNI